VTPAFFVFALDDGGTVEVEPTLAKAAAAIEPPDVDIADVVDDTGRRYSPVASGTETALIDSGEVDREDLQRRLLTAARLMSLQIPDDDDIVISMARTLGRRKWDQRWPRWPGWLDRRLHGDGPHPYF
jgi:hypothetical protein